MNFFFLRYDLYWAKPWIYLISSAMSHVFSPWEVPHVHDFMYLLD